MNREEYQRIKAICGDALDSRPEDRDSLIRSRCGGDLELEFEVRRMLGRVDEEGVLDRPPADTNWLRTWTAGVAGFEPGQVLDGRFELVRVVGRGGMGQVWEAHDRRESRRVAIKTLRPEWALDERARTRLAREVSNAKRVAHPNVCPTYDFFVDAGSGLPFLAMEFLEGEALSDCLKREHKLEATRAVAILEGCAAGLEAAHGAGLIHRDFKPANVMLVAGPKGEERAIVTDFGLSRLLDEVRTNTSLSAAGAGTPPYMAPEQTEGKDLTPAVDVFAFGVTACEVLTGKRPAEGGWADLPPAWRPVIRAALDPQPERRPARPGEVIARALGHRRRQALRWSGLGMAGAAAYGWWSQSGGQRAVRSVAILPFETAGDSASMLRSEGLVGEIHAALSRVPELRVIATESSLRNSRQLDLAAVGQRLDARSLLTGMVRFDTGRQQVSVRLIDSATRNVKWAEGFEGSPSEAMRFPPKIARAVASALGVSPLSSAGWETRLPTPGAHDAYLRGRALWSKRDPDSLRAALAAFDEALSSDPGFALAHAARADTLAILTEVGLLAGAEAFPRAAAAAREALRLAPDLPEGWAASGLVRSLGDWDLAAARADLEKAISLQPSSLYAHMWLTAVYSKAGLHAQAVEEARLTRQLDPLSARQLLSLGWTYIYARRFPEALEAGRQLDREFAGEIYSCALTANAWLGSGKTAEALAATEQCHPLYQRRPNFHGLRGLALARAGRRDEAERHVNAILGAGEPVAVLELAMIFAALGQLNEAFYWLDRAVDSRQPSVAYVPHYFPYDALRTDPRFAAFARRLQRK